MPSRLPKTARGKDTHFTGIARNVQQREERMGQNSEMTIWSFRIERHDASGNQLPPVPVEMRGFSFSGAVSNGDEVRVTGKWRGGTLFVELLDNLTTGAQVQAKSYEKARLACGILFLILFAAIMIASIAFFVYWFISLKQAGF